MEFLEIHIELFTANICSRCDDAKLMLSDIVAELDDDRLELDYIDVVEDIDHAVKTGVLATPAMAVNGKLVFCPLPERKQLVKYLRNELKV